VNTSSSSVRAMMLVLINHPDIQARLQVEVDTVVGPDRVSRLKVRILESTVGVGEDRISSLSDRINVSHDST
jgi:hypothetical protein